MNKQLLVAVTAIISTIGSVLIYNSFSSKPDSAPYELIAMADHERLAAGDLYSRINENSVIEFNTSNSSAVSATTSVTNTRNIFAPAINAVAISKFLNGNLPTTTPTGNIAIPALLSQTGAFQNLSTLEVSPGLIPYDMIEPFWSDGASKKRWMAIPNDGSHNTPEEQIQFSMDNAWDIPRGAVLIKHFELPGKKLETRFEVKGDDDVYYYLSYKWNAAQTDAELIDEAVYEDVVVNGVTQSWQYPGRNQCASCHYPQNGNVLGPKTRNLNKTILYPSSGIEMNQLVNLSELGILNETITLNNVGNYPAVAAKNDLSRSLEDRARSYIDVNCASCHNPEVENIAQFDARYTTPLANQNLIYGAVAYDEGLNNPKVIIPQDVANSMAHFRMNSTQTGIEMPPIAKDVVDVPGVQLIAEWIQSLTPATTSTPVANFSASSVYGSAPLSVSFDGSASSDADGDTLTFAWDFGDGNTAQGSTTSHVYTSPGSYVATLTVSDGSNTDIEITSIVVNNGNLGSNTVAFTDGTNLLGQDNFSGLPMGVIDMNGDGKDDIVQFNNARSLRIQYQNGPGQAFTTYNYGQVSSSNQWSTAIADIDKNGYNDILTGGAYDNIKIIANNNGNNSYDVSPVPDGNIFIQGSNFVDINNDGWADIFACHDDAESRAYQNNQNGSFTFNENLINTETTPVTDNSGNYASMWVDYDNDGDLDAYISKCRGGVTDPTDPRRINMLMQNDGNNNFTEVAGEANLKIGDQTWLTDFGDIDNDGDLDAIVINHGTGPNLMRNNGNGTFTEVTAGSGLLPTLAPENIFGIQGFFRDFNNDGYLDLMVSGNEHFIFYNNGDGTFQNATNPFNSNKIQSFSIGDINHDGFLDIYAGYAAGLNSPTTTKDRIWLNNGNSNNYLNIQLKGTQSNSNGIGARVEIYGAWGKQIRDVRSGEGYGLVNSYTQHFGIGTATQVDKVVVRWPSGIVNEILNPSANQFLPIIEGEESTTVTGVTLTPGSATLTEENTQQLTATVSPSNADDTTVLWSSSNTTIATVSANGLVTAVAAGTATITATTNDGSLTATSVITVETNTIAVTGITLNLANATLVGGNTQALVATVQPTNASNQNVTWASNNTAIATVSQNGLVTGVSAGTATITVTTSQGNYIATSEITIEAAAVGVAGISTTSNNSTIGVGNTEQITATITPTNASNPTVQWSSNNTSIATVDANGLVTAVAPGNTIITATTNDGNYTSNTSITVENTSCTEVTVQITFDRYARETTWQINDENGAAILSGGGYTTAQNSTTINETVCLPAGCYDFVINDTYGDGICCAYGQGSYEVTNASGNIFASGGAFTSIETTNFCIDDGSETCDLTGQSCDDGNACTTGETYDADCNCTGGTVTDTDGDGVCDAEDICEGGDDTIDTDGDGIPDHCDTPCTMVTVKITFDDYAREVSWQLNNSNGEAVLSGSGYSNADDFTTIYKPICLPAGCYDFVINDSYGDGICCRYGEGQYEVIDATGSVMASGGNYTTSETTNFCLNAAGSSSGLRAALPPSSSLTLSPVPTDNILNMEHHFAVASAEETTLSIFDVTGKLILHKTISKGYYDREIDVTQFTNGVYILKLSHGDEILVKQFIVKH